MPCFCLPPISVWTYMLKADRLWIETQEHYQKRSYRNKFCTLSAQGTQLFSVPLKKGKHQQKNIRDIEIAYDEDWVTRLARQVRTNYGAAPYFDYYFDKIMSIADTKYDRLFDLNMAWLSCMCTVLKVSPQISFTSDYVTLYPAEVLDLRGISTTKLKSALIGSYEYEQVYSDRLGFTADLSIVDALFCLGPQTSSLLHDLSTKTVHLSSKT